MSEPYYADEAVTLWHGDALEVLREMPDGAVDCCVTSPPYLLADTVEFLGAHVEDLSLGESGSRDLHAPDHVLTRSRGARRSLSMRVCFSAGPVLGRAQGKAVLSLHSLDPKVREHRNQGVRGHAIGCLPVVQRAAVRRGRALCHQRSTERRLEQFGDIRRDLLEADALTVCRLPPDAMTCRVGRAAYPDRPVRIHRARQVRGQL